MGYEAVAGRDLLPIPDIPAAGLTTYDAKDPDTTYPPIEPLRPPAGAPDDRGRVWIATGVRVAKEGRT